MNFVEALKLVMQGKKVILKSVQDQVNKMELRGLLFIRLSDNKDCLVAESKQGYIQPWPFEGCTNLLNWYIAEDWIEVD